MKRSPADETTAKNLEEKFERGEDVLEYFDVRQARVLRPAPTRAAGKTTASPSSAGKRESRAVIVREEPAGYPPSAAKPKRQK